MACDQIKKINENEKNKKLCNNKKYLACGTVEKFYIKHIENYYDYIKIKASMLYNIFNIQTYIKSPHWPGNLFFEADKIIDYYAYRNCLYGNFQSCLKYFENYLVSHVKHEKSGG